MRKNLFFVFFLLFHFVGKASLTDDVNLNEEISSLNDSYKYEKSITILEEVLTNKKSGRYDRYNAYLQKSLTYKRIYNYPEVLENLDHALKQAVDSDFYEEAEVRVLAERMFVEFDSGRFEEARKLHAILSAKNINHLNPEAHGFYLGVSAVLHVIDKNYGKAESILNEAVALLTKHDPKHLPMIYAKIIGLAEHLKDREMAMNAFEQGMLYADQYRLDIYKMALYNTMAQFFVGLEDYRNAYFYHSKGSEISGRYNAALQSGKLAVLEKRMLEKRKNMQLDYEKKKSYLLAFSSVLLLVLFSVTFKLYQSKKEKNRLIAQENDRIRAELKRLVLAQKKEAPLRLSDYELTLRQLDIINLVKQGKTNKEIGQELFISENTVKYHLKTIYTILGIANRWDLK